MSSVICQNFSSDDYSAPESIFIPTCTFYSQKKENSNPKGQIGVLSLPLLLTMDLSIMTDGLDYEYFLVLKEKRK